MSKRNLFLLGMGCVFAAASIFGNLYHRWYEDKLPAISHHYQMAVSPVSVIKDEEYCLLLEPKDGAFFAHVFPCGDDKVNWEIDRYAFKAPLTGLITGVGITVTVSPSYGVVQYGEIK